MGADVMRWQFCEANPGQNIKFGYGPAHEVKRRLLTLWNSVKFFVDYANVSGEGEAGELEPLDRWLFSRTEQLVVETTDAYERFWTPDVVALIRVVRRRSVELVHPPLAAALLGRRRRRVGDAAHGAPAVAHRDRPVMPFLAEHLWRVLRSDDQPESIFLAGWPEVGKSTRSCSRGRRNVASCRTWSPGA